MMVPQSSVALLAIASFAIPSLAQDTNGTTNSSNSLITLPSTFTNHGNPNLICQPTKWTDLLTFFMVNYFAHAATVIIKPGCSVLEKVYIIFFALILPGAGAYKALLTIAHGILGWSDGELKRAARAGALCMMVDMDRINEMERKINKDDSMRSRAINGFGSVHLQREAWISRITGRSIHGHVQVPDGYIMVLVPENARFADEAGSDFKVCTNYSVIGIAVGLVQTLFGIATLYNTRGDQIERYGYAAFGLTVTPYALMSLLNGVAAFCMPNYPSLFLVESSTKMKQTRVSTKAGGASEKVEIDEPCMRGAVARLATEYEEELYKTGPQNPAWSHRFWRWTWLYTAVCIAIVGGISRFDPGSSTAAQRGWVMSWIVIGGVMGNFIFSDDDYNRRISLSKWTVSEYLHGLVGGSDPKVSKLGLIVGLVLAALLCVGWIATPVGGMITVGQMLNEYGICQEL